MIFSIKSHCVKIAILINLSLIGCVSPMAQEQQPKQLVLAHIGAPGTLYDLTANEFARRVNAQLFGRYQVIVAGNSSLGDDEELLKKVQKGEIAFASQFAPLVKAMPKFSAFDLPYLILSRDHIRKVRSTLLEKYLRPEAKQHGLILLGMWENGFRHVTTGLRPIVTPRDLQRLRLRVPPGSWRSRVFRSFGADIKEIPLKQLFEALNRAMAANKLTPVIDKVFSFDEAPAAYRYLQSAQHFGKVVIALP